MQFCDGLKVTAKIRRQMRFWDVFFVEFFEVKVGWVEMNFTQHLCHGERLHQIDDHIDKRHGVQDVDGFDRLEWTSVFKKSNAFADGADAWLEQMSEAGAFQVQHEDRPRARSIVISIGFVGDDVSFDSVVKNIMRRLVARKSVENQVAVVVGHWQGHIVLMI